MRRRIVFSVAALIAVLATPGCQESPTTPSTTTPPEVEPEPEVRTPQEARGQLQERGIQYSKKSFFAYADSGNIDVVRLFVAAGMDVNAQNDERQTALYLASRGGYSEVVNFLVDSGAENLSAALRYAASGGHLEVMLFLSEKGADLGVNFSDRATPLTLAAYGGHLEVVRYLVENGYDDERGDDNEHGDWALVQAARGGHLDVVRFLVTEGFELNPVYFFDASRGDTPLIYAAYEGHPKVVQFLVENGANIHIRTAPTRGSQIKCAGSRGHHFWYGSYTFYAFSDEGCTALIAATEQGHEEVAAYLIDHWMTEFGADDSDEFGATALMFAAQIGDLSRVKALSDNGAEINAETKMGFNAFLLAVHGGDLEVIRHFLELGSDINHQTPVGSTALMFASYLGDLDTVHLLLDKGADADAQTKEFRFGGHTALMAAAFTGHLDVVRLLVENGADIDITDRNGRTALFWATQRGHQEVASYLSSL